MPEHHETRLLPYTADQLFDLVMDIEKYPEFLPWCLSARILKKKKTELTADVVIGYKVFRETFSSRVHFKPGKSIEVDYISGPMSHLTNSWSFRDVRSRQCEVTFHVAFDMRSRLLEALVNQFFHRALAKMVNAFEARARALYGGSLH